MSSWTFLSHHAHVLLLLCEESDLRVRDIATRTGISERAAQRVLHDLVAGSYVSVHKVGRRNRYEPRLSAPLRHPLEAGRNVGDLVAGLAAGSKGG